MVGALIGFGILLFALFGGPLFVLLAAAAIAGYATSGDPISSIIIDLNRLTKNPTIMIIPLFTFAGYVMAESRAPKRLIAFAQASVGWLPGGIAVVVLVTCAFFTTFTGASGVTIIALGGLLYPILRQNYTEKFSLGLITASGSLGILFPPSIPLILYAIIAQVPIDQMFLAGVIPGFLLLLILSGYCSGWSTFKRIERTAFDLKACGRALWEAKWEVVLPFIVLGSIVTGIVTIDEAAPLTAIYLLIVEMFIHRDIRLRDLPKIVRESMLLVGAILIILGIALGLTNYFVTIELPTIVLEWINTHTQNKIVTLIGINLFLLAVGCLMDIFSAIIVIVPLLIPIAEEFGIDKAHLGVIVLTNLEIGYLTPPVGMNLFISSLKFDKPVVFLYRSVLLFIGLLLIALIFITYLPDLSLWLPRVFGKTSVPLLLE
ncbi:TRAP transporter large permease [Candidatus Poribacteria bacterium]|nr:TRAP transporter large permease [Candidatus Poribacteria bacterium]